MAAGVAGTRRRGSTTGSGASTHPALCTREQDVNPEEASVTKPSKDVRRFINIDSIKP
jgi:hypothetical protein